MEGGRREESKEVGDGGVGVGWAMSMQGVAGSWVTGASGNGTSTVWRQKRGQSAEPHPLLSKNGNPAPAPTLTGPNTPSRVHGVGEEIWGRAGGQEHSGWKAVEFFWEWGEGQSQLCLDRVGRGTRNGGQDF